MDTTIRVAATGDAILTHPISADTSPGFIELVQLLRDADATITNLEMVLPPAPRHPSTTMHGTPLGVDPAMLDEFDWLGIDLFGLANNHATDYGTDGSGRHTRRTRPPWNALRRRRPDLAGSTQTPLPRHRRWARRVHRRRLEQCPPGAGRRPRHRRRGPGRYRTGARPEDPLRTHRPLRDIRETSWPRPASTSPPATPPPRASTSPTPTATSTTRPRRAASPWKASTSSPTTPHAFRPTR